MRRHSDSHPIKRQIRPCYAGLRVLYLTSAFARLLWQDLRITKTAWLIVVWGRSLGRLQCKKNIATSNIDPSPSKVREDGRTRYFLLIRLDDKGEINFNFNKRNSNFNSTAFIAENFFHFNAWTLEFIWNRYLRARRFVGNKVFLFISRKDSLIISIAFTLLLNLFCQRSDTNALFRKTKDFFSVAAVYSRVS